MKKLTLLMTLIHFNFVQPSLAQVGGRAASELGNTIFKDESGVILLGQFAGAVDRALKKMAAIDRKVQEIEKQLRRAGVNDSEIIYRRCLEFRYEGEDCDRYNPDFDIRIYAYPRPKPLYKNWAEQNHEEKKSWIQNWLVNKFHELEIKRKVYQVYSGSYSPSNEDNISVYYALNFKKQIKTELPEELSTLLISLLDTTDENAWRARADKLAALGKQHVKKLISLYGSISWVGNQEALEAGAQVLSFGLEHVFVTMEGSESPILLKNLKSKTSNFDKREQIDDLLSRIIKHQVNRGEYGSLFQKDWFYSWMPDVPEYKMVLDEPSYVEPILNVNAQILLVQKALGEGAGI